ncbi:T9SS type A sorting domain-containing protein [Dyadobacter sp. CY327]|uniref:T9SS type A sorting domain-containing protein n=1 Tax=Dyadobacter sp. CY327 TaxID=2907301 RepID=UPI001F257482|nr:T9SS type A sorting domain-containing protein [Dyadobacter sp. CY327]MCE7071883.1 T9SS type A sorting domain-containing protein [Dyadobacter sp. CY327]
MKRILLLLITLSTISAIPIYGQSCSGNFTVSQNTICLTQSITLQVAACVGDGTVTWAYATSENGTYTDISTSPMTWMRCNVSFTYTPTSAGTFWYKASFVSSSATPLPPCSWNPVQVVVGAGNVPPAPTITAATTCPDVSLSITGPVAEYSKVWQKLSSPNPNWGVMNEQTGNSIIAPHAGTITNPVEYRVLYKNESCTGSPSNAISISNYGVAPYYTTSTTPDVTFSYSYGNGLTDIKDNCKKLLAQFEGSGGIGGGTFPAYQLKARASFDNTIKTYNGSPYLTRHYDFVPSTSATYPATPTSYSVQLYFTQAEFDAFNATTSSETPKLPKQPNGNYGYFNDNGDFIDDGSIYYGKTPLRVLFAHGQPSVAGGGPETYTSVDELYNPVSGTSNADIYTSWNTYYNVWQVTIRNLTNFSGFFITTEDAQPLPVTLLNFNAQKQENGVMLDWQTTEETNSERFEIQHSTDGKRWSEIAKVNAAGDSKVMQRYTYMHTNPAPRDNLYRMKMVDRDATFAMSRILSVNMNVTPDLNVYPNPVTNSLSATSEQAIIGYRLVSPGGKIVSENSRIRTTHLELENISAPAGLYVLTLNFENGGIENRKLIIE